MEGGEVRCWGEMTVEKQTVYKEKTIQHELTGILNSDWLIFVHLFYNDL